ncbi:ATPase [Candidatus Woesearchaeota archaeon]|nr:ATPase [Candidatus Woesearchaeota archaeon]
MKKKKKATKLSRKTYVVDTSIVIERKVSDLVKKKKIAGKIIIPRAVLAELENQANQNQSEGFIGLEEITSLRELAKKKKIHLDYEGERPKEWHIKRAHAGAIDDMIRSIAYDKRAVLITADRVQSLVAEAMGIKTILILPVSAKKIKALDIEKFFTPNTMSVHLKEDSIPLAKQGKPGKWQFKLLRKTKLSAHDVKVFAADIIEKTKLTQGAFIEISSPGINIVQFKNFRIVICKPPFSDGWEITAVRPVATLELKDYNLSNKLKQRLKTSATGILVSGAPGSGKTTFTAALAKFYAKEDKIIKTIESPRDLQVPDKITQYSKDFGSRQSIHNVLLLTRPDYTMFDEMRTTHDFKLYADLRLAGIGLAGVIHATNPIDAVQRFVGRVELGMIPQIIDTVVFIDKGEVDKVLELSMRVKVPTGMTEADLARPIVEVNDFETGQLEYEIYSYGEHTVVVPIKKRRRGRTQMSIPYRIKETKKFINFYFKDRVRSVNLQINNKPIKTLSVNRKGTARIYKKSKLGRQVLDALVSGKDISFTR